MIHLDLDRYAGRMRRIDSVIKYYATDLKVLDVGPNHALLDMCKWFILSENMCPNINRANLSHGEYFKRDPVSYIVGF